MTEFRNQNSKSKIPNQKSEFEIESKLDFEREAKEDGGRHRTLTLTPPPCDLDLHPTTLTCSEDPSAAAGFLQHTSAAAGFLQHTSAAAGFLQPTSVLLNDPELRSSPDPGGGGSGILFEGE